MKYKNDDLEELLNRIDGEEEGLSIFSTMVSFVMAGHWRDRLDTMEFMLRMAMSLSRRC